MRRVVGVGVLGLVHRGRRGGAWSDVLVLHRVLQHSESLPVCAERRADERRLLLQIVRGVVVHLEQSQCGAHVPVRAAAAVSAAVSAAAAAAGSAVSEPEAAAADAAAAVAAAVAAFAAAFAAFAAVAAAIALTTTLSTRHDGRRHVG